jgi:hypothetical protein
MGSARSPPIHHRKPRYWLIAAGYGAIPEHSARKKASSRKKAASERSGQDDAKEEKNYVRDKSILSG